MQRSSTVEPPKVHAAHTDAPETERQHRQHKAARSTLLFLPLAGIVMLLVVLFGYSALQSGRIFHGVRVLGKDLSGLSAQDARAAVAQATAGYPTNSIAVSGSDHNWTFAPADLGISVDVDKTVTEAMNVGRSSGFLANVGTQVGALFGGARINPVLKQDTAPVDKVIAQIASQVNKPAVDSKLEQASDGTVQVTASSAGTVIDQDATRAALMSALNATTTGPIQVAMRQDTPKITEAALKDAQAQALLLTDKPVGLTLGDKSWSITPEQLRGMLDLSAPPAGSSEWKATLNNNSLAAYLQPIADEVRVEPKDASVTVGKGTVTLDPEKAGSDLDAPAAIALIEKAAISPDDSGRSVELPVKETPANVHTADVQSLYDKTNALVTQGIRLRYRDDGYILRGSSVTGFLDVAMAQGGPQYQLTIDHDVLADRVGGVAYYINRNPSDARYRLVNGTPTKITDAQDGLKVNIDQSVQNVLKAIDSYTGGDRLQVDLDVSVTPPAVNNVDMNDASNTPDLLGSGQTSYANSSAERAWNVGLGTRNLDGALVPPGGTFSTDDTIGDLTLEAGFKMGYAIVHTANGLSTVPAEAGGICQVSTTLFHSVFWAGLPVVERHSHSYWISLYGVPPSGLQGLDATISPPDLDFRFKNTTGHWLLIKSTADGKNVTFQLYGVNPGWHVKTSGPVITNRVKTSTDPITENSSALPAGKKVLVEHAQDGFDSTIGRVVTDSSGNVIDNWTIHSHYEPAHNRYLVGTGN